VVLRVLADGLLRVSVKSVTLEVVASRSRCCAAGGRPPRVELCVCAQPLESAPAASPHLPRAGGRL
jgi:hypothetical protein